MTLSDLFTAIANAIRAKGGTSAQIYPNQMAQAISNIQPQISLETKQVSFTPSETAQSQSVTPGSGYDGLDEVDVSVGAIDSSYVGSGVTRRSSSDLSASGATVNVPAGYYEQAASKAVSSGSAKPPTTISGSGATLSTGTNTITLQKTVSATPRVTAGYVDQGTSDSVLLSLNANVTTKTAATIHPSGSDQTIAASQYLTGAQTIKGVQLTNLLAENIKEGVVVEVGDSTDSDCVTSVTGTYQGGGSGSSKNTQVASGANRVAASTYTAVSGQSLTVAKTGTYDVYWTGYRSSTSGTNGSRLYIDGSAYGSAQTTFSNNAQAVHLSNVSLTQGQTIEVRARSRSTSYYMYVGNLTIVEA